MNKKFLTLLAGAFLGFTAVSSVNAQYLEQQQLRVGKEVPKLQEGANPGYYYLMVDSVASFGTGIPVDPLLTGEMSLAAIDSLNGGRTMATVLFMGPDSLGRHKLFIDRINKASNTRGYGEPFSSTSGIPGLPSKGERAGSALWCVTVNKEDQGQNPTFDFTNKLREQLLEVDVYDHESWEMDTLANGVKAYPMSGADTTLVPGGISAWEFSETYATVLNHSKPLISYIDENHDSVAVLCVDTTKLWGSDRAATIIIKIVPATAVKLGQVAGVLYFSLREAMPWALDKDDYEFMLGTQTSSAARKLTFDPDVTSGETNIFSQKNLNVEYFGVDPNVARIDTATVHRAWTRPANGIGASNYAVICNVTGGALDTMGYFKLKDGSNYVKVLNEYHANTGNDRFLKIGSVPAAPSNTTFADSCEYGQYAWRMVYYPSADSIYVNAFKASYLPDYFAQFMSEDTLTATSWNSQKVQSWYSYNAIPDSLVTDGWAKGVANQWWELKPEVLMTLRLKPGHDPNKSAAELPYKYYNRLYVTIQDIVRGSRSVATLGTSAFTNNVINTQINFGIYSPCLVSSSNTGRATVDADLYLIRNEAGQYLCVPLYSAHDSAVWVDLDMNVHPEMLPSFQWIVEKKYAASTVSPVNIINREFGYKVIKPNTKSGAKVGDYGVGFTNVQLQTISAPFKFRAKDFKWNKKNINAKVVEFTTSLDMGAKNAASFIKLPKTPYKDDPNLGYTYIDPDTSVVNLYGFNYDNGLSDKFYIKPGKTESSFVMGAYPNTDTLLYVNGSDYFDIGYFRIDTAAEEYGSLKTYGYPADSLKKKNKLQIEDLVTLKRQAYRILYENPFKYCSSDLCLSNAEQGRYSLSSKLKYKKVLGKPLFWLRNVYDDNTGDPSFAMVQIVDTATINDAGGYTQTSQFTQYVTSQLGSTVANAMLDNISYAGEVNPGFFVVGVDDQMMSLKSQYRPDVQTRVSTFRLRKDTDPMYRRFNTEKEGTHAGDAPEIVKFYTTNNTPYQLFENTGALSDQKNYYTGDGKNYLGLVNTNQNPNAKTAIYVDTAFVNRGKGYIRPQYMLMIRPTVTEDTLACDDFGELTVKIDGYKRGMYLINATDSADVDGTPDEDYIWNTSWERLVFTDAIHANDKLYILGGADLTPVTSSNGQIDLKKLDDVAVPASKANKGSGKIQFYNLGETIKDGTKDTGWPTYKDCVFQFRLIERRADDFLIESETTDRSQEPSARPCYGGWIKIQNGVPVISRSDVVFAESQAEIFNVLATTEAPVANEDAPATTEVKVVANNGSVTIMNAAGKKVVISNVLGQTVANTVLTSDNATIAAPQGVVVVAIEGEAAVKALVK